MTENTHSFMNRFLHFGTLLRRYDTWQQRENGLPSSRHHGQGRLLALLKLQPEITQRQLVYVLDMSRQAVSECLAKLEAADYITRTPDPNDRRVMRIKLTARGQQIAEQAENSGSDDIFDVLTPEEQTTLDRLLGKVEHKLLSVLPARAQHPAWRDAEHLDESPMMPGCPGMSGDTRRPGCGMLRGGDHLEMRPGDNLGMRANDPRDRF